jgi:hypothetical protein
MNKNNKQSKREKKEAKRKQKEIFVMGNNIISTDG